MRILFLAHRIPFPPNKGDKIRSFHEVRGLVSRGHELHLLAFADDPNDVGYRSELLAAGCASVFIQPLDRRVANLRALTRLASRQPLSLAFYSSRRMRERVASTLSTVRPDAMIAYSSSVAQYVPAPLASRSIVDLVDLDSEKWREYAVRSSPPLSWIYAEESRRLGAYERALAARVAAIVVTTDRERADLVRTAGNRIEAGRIHVVQNGVDLDYFRPDGPTGAGDQTAPRSLVFTGAMDYYANVDAVTYFAEDVLPLIRAEAADTRFVIVGSNPTAQVRRLAALPGVVVTGAVHDIRPYVAGADVAVAPLRIARGIQNKILEAMAMGRPVVATSSAAAGLSAVPGRDLLVADAPAAFAKAVVSLIDDSALRARVGENARQFVSNAHDWQASVDRLASLVAVVCGGGGRGGGSRAGA